MKANNLMKRIYNSKDGAIAEIERITEDFETEIKTTPIKVTRIIEYIGTPEWVKKTLDNGLIPSGEGEYAFPNGCLIRSHIQDIQMKE
jgi:hypothetical protein